MPVYTLGLFTQQKFQEFWKSDRQDKILELTFALRFIFFIFFIFF